MEHAVLAGAVPSTTFKIKGGHSAAGTTTFNGIAGARMFGGALASHLTIQEIMA